MHYEIKQHGKVLVTLPLSHNDPQGGFEIDDGDQQMLEAIAKALCENNFMAPGYYETVLIVNPGVEVASLDLIL